MSHAQMVKARQNEVASSDPRRSALGLLIVAAGAIVIVPAMYAVVCQRPMNCDPFVYGSLAKDVMGGKRLYLDTWQDKPPLAVLCYALPQLVAPRSYPALGAFCGLVIAAQGLLMARAFRASLPAAIGCLLFSTLIPMAIWDCDWPSTEHFANLFVVANVLIAYKIVREGRFTLLECFLVGVSSCAAFHIRQNIVLSGALPALMVLLAPASAMAKFRGACAGLAGGLAVWGLVLGLVLKYGDLHGYFYTVFLYPRAYAGEGSFRLVIDLAAVLWMTPLPFMMALFGYIAATPRYRWLVIASVVIGLLSCVAPMRAYSHYWINLFPYASLIFGLAAQQTETRDRRMAWVYVVVAAIAMLPITGARLLNNFMEPQTERCVRVAERVDQIAPPGATLTVCGPSNCELVQFSSKLLSANRYSWVNQFQPPWISILPDSIDTIFAGYLADPPTILVVDEEYLRTALSPEGPPKGYNPMQLVQRLCAQHKYRIVETVNGLVIAILDEKRPVQAP